MGWLVIGMLLGMASTTASAGTFTVDSARYTKDDSISAVDPFDAHEVTAQSGQHVKYSVTATSGCTELYFVKGHSVSPSSQYYVSYSQENCVGSYSNEFPVDSTDGTQFTVLILTTGTASASYTLTVETFTPAVPNWAIGIIVLVVIIVVIAAIRVAIQRRKAASAPPPLQPPMMPPLQPPQPPPGP